MLEYLYKAVTVWFFGFFPFFEIIVAVPAGLAIGLDPFSVIIFSVAGNITPIFLIEYGYSWLMKSSRIQNWVNKLYSEKVSSNVNKYGIWYILLITPWVGVWAMGVAAKVLKMKKRVFIWGSFFSILAYAIVTVILIQLGINIFT
ncbi:MAG: small multi-drug export protein [Balneolales bacterium]